MILNNINKEKKYLLAVSGGIDSMVMCDLFLKANINFAVAHCNFQLREEASDLDEKIVTDWCGEHKITFYSKKMNTISYAEENKKSIQVAARELRYAFFKELLNEHKLDFVATAHHQDDNIETVLFHFFRGTGIKGMTGIPAENNSIVRPMLQISKSEILRYAAEHNIAFRDDASNKKNEYTRNKFRNVIIPQLEEIFPEFKNNIAQNIARLHEVNEVYSKQIESNRKKLIEARGKDIYIPINKLKFQTPIATILYELLKPYFFSYEQSLQVLQMMNSQTGSLVENDTYRVIKNRDFFIVSEKNTEHTDLILINENDKHILVSDFDLKLMQKEKRNMELQKSEDYCQVDYSKLEFPLILRKWRAGDYLYPLGMTKKKKIARILIDAKVPLHEKENCWVLESNKKIVWLVGIKIDDRFKLTNHTEKVIEILYKKGK